MGPMREANTAALPAVIVGAFALLLFACLPAMAQDDSLSSASAAGDERTRIAEGHHRAALKAFAKGSYRVAVARWLEANSIRPSAAIAFNIARSYERLGEAENELAWYRDYLHKAEHPSDQSRVARRIEELEKRLASRGVQQVTVRSSPSGAAVEIDGERVGSTPWTGTLTPGSHPIVLSLARHDDVAERFDLPKEHALNLELVMTRTSSTMRALDGRVAHRKPDPLIATAPAETRADLKPRRALGKDERPPRSAQFPTLTILGVIALGASAAAIGGAIAFERLRSRAEEEARDQDTQIGFADSLETMHSRQTWARVFVGVGAGLTVTGGALLLWGASDSEERPTTRVALACPLTSCGASVTGSL